MRQLALYGLSFCSKIASGGSAALVFASFLAAAMSPRPFWLRFPVRRRRRVRFSFAFGRGDTAAEDF
jgi:hypothetical protein